MARNKLSAPSSRRTRGKRAKSQNFGWWIAVILIVVLGTAGVVMSREGGGGGTGVVDEVLMPDVGGAELITVTSVAHEAYDRVDEGDPIFEVEADGTTREIDAPKDGFLVEINVEEGTGYAPGTRLGTVQSGPDFSGSNPLGNHWHTAYGVFVCGTDWLGQLSQTTGDFHTHGDGLMHAHPQSSAAAGERATIGLWFERQGGSISGDHLDYPGAGRFESGDVDCNGEDGVLRWALNGEEREGDPGDVVVGNGDVFVVAFVPEDAELPTVPPSMATMAQNYAPPKHPDYQPPPEEVPDPEAAPDAGAGAEAPESEADADTAPEAGADGEADAESEAGATTTTAAEGEG